MSAFPPTVGGDIGSDLPTGVFRRPGDTTKYLVERRRFERPRLSIIGGDEFEWPLGVEGISIAGTAALAEHLYIGDNAAVVQVMHRDNRRITMTGIFPGLTGSINVTSLLEIITAETPDNAKVLTLPFSIFHNTQVVVPETWNFDHAEGDASDSWTYTITFRRTGVSQKVIPPKTVKSPVNPAGNKTKPRGNSTRVFVVRNSASTLRAVASNVFDNPNRWREIYDKNQKALNKLNVPLVSLATKKLPLGMRLYY